MAFTPSAKVNNTGNVRSGRSYFTEAVKGRAGNYHVYDNGKRVYVGTAAERLAKKKKKKTKDLAWQIEKAAGRRAGSSVGRFVNRTSNSRAGQTYSATRGKGGMWHTYSTGARVFVKKKPPRARINTPSSEPRKTATSTPTRTF